MGLPLLFEVDAHQISQNLQPLVIAVQSEKALYVNILTVVCHHSVDELKDVDDESV